MAAKSFKQMIKDGDLKRADAMKARLEDLHEEPGFNLRAEGEDLEQSIADLADYLHQGGIVPALEVRPREEGGMWVVDGHRRRRAYLKLDAEGRLPRDPNGEFWVPIVAFAGNDAERVLRVITSQEGRKLSLLSSHTATSGSLRSDGPSNRSPKRWGRPVSTSTRCWS